MTRQLSPDAMRALARQLEEAAEAVEGVEETSLAPADAGALGGRVKPGHDTQSYEDFLRGKIRLAPAYGFEVPAELINPQLKDFVREAVVPWAAAGGRRAVFSSFGLHKTSVQIELARLALKLHQAVPLIVLPLGVRQEFFDDAARFFTGEFAVSLNFIRRTEEARADAINLTNYESVREGKIDASAFGFVSLDEAAILRGFGGSKTFREFMRLWENTRYRFVCTATPDPNEFIELLAYAAFLGIMDVGQAKTRWFKRDSTQADKLTILPSKEREFWLWVASWALFIRRPSDLCRCSCHNEKNLLDSVSENSSPSHGPQASCETVHGSAAAIAATQSLSHQTGCCEASSSAADAPGQSTAEKERALTQSGAASSTDAHDQITKTGPITADAELPSANGGEHHLQISSPTWVNQRQEQPSTASTMTETTSRPIADGPAAKSKPITGALGRAGGAHTSCRTCRCNDGYEMPPLDVRWHEVPSDHTQAGNERDGQGRMFRDPTISVSETAKEKRSTIAARIGMIRRIIDEARRPELHQGIPPQEPGEAPGAKPTPLSGEQGQLQSAIEEVAGREPRAGERIGAQASPSQSGEVAGGIAELVSQEQGSASGDGIQTPLRDHAGAIRNTVNGSERLLRNLSEGAAADDASAGGPLPRDEEDPRVAVPQMQRSAGAVGGRSAASDEGGGLPDQLVIWCDLNDEQRAIENALKDAAVSFASLYGNQEIDERETLLRAWKTKERTAFVSKPVMYGAGVNMQQCHTMIFAGIGFKFAELIQAVHRCKRFGQKHRVTVHLIYSEAERSVRRTLEEKWRRHEQQAEIMSAIIREYGLARMSLAAQLQRSIGCEREEAAGNGWKAVHNDTVIETAAMADNSVHLILTSIPFSTQFEYTPSYNDFGHSEDNAEFWRQMDYLTPQLFRVLAPGRNACIHVKDRIVPGGMTGLGFQTVYAFHADAIAHYTKHGFAFLGMHTIATDVVRENNQTYRLGWTEQCHDGTRMGCGMPEYLLVFRKPPSDSSNGYADVPVAKPKPLCDDHGEPRPFDKKLNWRHPVPGSGYSRARWQLDAHGFWRSSGNRLLSSEELKHSPHEALYKRWRAASLESVYSYAEHVRVCEEMEQAQRLPSTFMQFPAHSDDAGVWTDVARMRTLNMRQVQKGQEMHLCPLQFDIVERVIEQRSSMGETVFDPFMGIGTVPLLAYEMGRTGIGVELSQDYWADAVAYLKAAEEKMAIPSLFDMLDAEVRKAAE